MNLILELCQYSFPNQKINCKLFISCIYNEREEKYEYDYSNYDTTIKECNKRNIDKYNKFLLELDENKELVYISENELNPLIKRMILGRIKRNILGNEI